MPLQAQNNNALVGFGAGAILSGILIANSVENVREGLEKKMIGYVLEHKEFSKKVAFELKLIKWDVTKKEDLNNVSIIGYSYNEVGANPVILLNTCSSGWVNEYGINFSKVDVIEIDKKYWEKIMLEFLNISKTDPELITSTDRIPVSLKKGKTSYTSLKNLVSITSNYLEFRDSENGLSRFNFINFSNDIRIAKDFDEKIKILFHEGNMNFLLRGSGDLVEIKRNFLLDINSILYTNSRNVKADQNQY
jgi:hypothetical protein